MIVAIIPKMPEEYKGEYLKKGVYIKTTPRKWTNKEIDWCLKLEKQGFTYKEIAESIDRDYTSVTIKMKRLKKKDGRYNENHINEKYKINREFINYIKPKSILDVYSGKESFYKNMAKIVVTNDKNKGYNTDYNLDALKLLCLLYYKGKKFDVIDLDPYGSAVECFDLAIKMANKGLIITLGEIGHKRWNRLDYVRRFYDIEKIEDFTTENLIKKIQHIGQKYKKDLIVWKYMEWQNISRVWFEIKNIKIIEQWIT